MVLSEFPQAGKINLTLKQQYEKEITNEQRSTLEEEQHLSDLTHLFFLLERGPSEIFVPCVQHWTVYPDPRPVLEECFSNQAPTPEWLIKLHAAITHLLSFPPHASEQQKQFVERAVETLDAAAATIA